MQDRLWRWAYRLAFRIARLWWWLCRPNHHGTAVAVWQEGRVLVLQQSYRPNPAWPGGGIRRGEDAREAARRELAEEVGLHVEADELHLACAVVVDWDFGHDHVRVFELRLGGEPRITIDNREIVAAHFVDPAALLVREDLPPFIRAYLEGARGA